MMHINFRLAPSTSIVAMTGATGAILGIKLLMTLGKLNVETHLVMSKTGQKP